MTSRTRVQRLEAGAFAGAILEHDIFAQLKVWIDKLSKAECYAVKIDIFNLERWFDPSFTEDPDAKIIGEAILETAKEEGMIAETREKILFRGEGKKPDEKGRRIIAGKAYARLPLGFVLFLRLVANDPMAYRHLSRPWKLLSVCELWLYGFIKSGAWVKGSWLENRLRYWMKREKAHAE